MGLLEPFIKYDNDGGLALTMKEPETPLQDLR